MSAQIIFRRVGPFAISRMCDISVPLISTCVQAPDCSLVGPVEKILLFRHQPSSEQLLLRLREGSQLQDGDLIEVVIAGRWGPF